MALSDYLLPISQPTQFKSVFNPVEYEYGFNTINLAQFDTTNLNGNASVLVNSEMASLINVNDYVLIGGGASTQVKGQRLVLQKILISTTLYRLELDTPYSGLSPSGTIIPFKKLPFKIWAGYEGEGSTILPWQLRDSILVSPDITTLTYKFQVQSFLKKYFELTSPLTGNDYNLSLRYSVLPDGLTGEFKDSLNGYYGFKNPTTVEIQDRIPFGEYPINFVSKSLEKLPVLHSIIDNEGVGINTNFTNRSFETSILDWENDGSGQVFVWNNPSSARADGIASSTANTARFGQELAGGWPIGKYRVKMIVSNQSTYVSSPFNHALFVFASNNSVGDASVIAVSYSGDGSVPDGVTDKTIIVDFELTAVWDYISFKFNKSGPTSGSKCNIILKEVGIINQVNGYVRNILSNPLPSLITASTYHFEALANNTYTLLFQHSGVIASLNTVPSLPSWITIQSSPTNQIKLSINTSALVDGDFSAVDYSEEDFSVLSFNNLIGCYQYVFRDGVTPIFTLSFCIHPIAETIKVCPDNVLNFAYLNSAGGYNSIALDCTYLNGRELGEDNTFKTSDNILKRSSFNDVYDTITLSTSVVSKRMLDLLKEMRSSIHVLLYNNESLAFDIPVVIERSNITTYGNKFNQAQSRVSMTVKKAKEILIQTQ